ncbi:MAG: hypothetical protein K0S56_2382 [Microvirga sp.]|nr:hypothetical protein [Microvirga sp.]
MFRLGSIWVSTRPITCRQPSPASLAALLATLDDLKKPDAYRRLFELGDYLRQQLDEILARTGVPAQAAGFGSIWLPYFFKGGYRCYEDLLANDDRLDLAFRQAMVARRYISQPLPLKRLYLSLAHTRAIVDEALDDIEVILKDLARPSALREAVA